MAIPNNTSIRPASIACFIYRDTNPCPDTVYTRDADDVAAFDAAGPSLNFSLRFNSMYVVMI